MEGRHVRPPGDDKIESAKKDAAEADGIAMAYGSQAMRDFLARCKDPRNIYHHSLKSEESATDAEKEESVRLGTASANVACEVERNKIMKDFLARAGMVSYVPEDDDEMELMMAAGFTARPLEVEVEAVEDKSLAKGFRKAFEKIKSAVLSSKEGSGESSGRGGGVRPGSHR